MGLQQSHVQTHLYKAVFLFFTIVEYFHCYLAHHVHVGHFCSVVAAGTAAVALGDVLSSYLAEASFLYLTVRGPIV